MFRLVTNSDSTIDLYYGDSVIVRDVVTKGVYDTALELCE